ncbi:MAG: AmmeMemoRadiSam system radical SAM enzyme [Pirellulaceae bacterium]|nr:AmmeMemoRadiSam system radical SAM enzyme [Pirellulaceae bacterium]
MQPTSASNISDCRRLPDGSAEASWWRPASKVGRLDCLLCPRQCSLADGDRGFCIVRENRGGQMVLSTYGRSTGFCIDPIEKKPLNHFFPGTAVLSFGTAGCNLGCQYCQNWDISKSREIERLSETAEPEAIARAAQQTDCLSVAFTYNDPVIWAEYAIDTARYCRQLGIKTVAVTAGYISPPAREAFFAWMDAANVDLKAFTEQFYSKITYSHLQPVLDTLSYLVRETQVWVEITNLVIPDLNDGPDEMRRLCDWIVQQLGDRVPIHFSAFHPDFRMRDRGRTPPETLFAAYDIARSSGLKFPYVGNIHDDQRQATYCPGCSALLIERDWYQVGAYHIDVSQGANKARCPHCQASVAGWFNERKGTWGAQRQPVRMAQFADASPAAQAIAGVPPTVPITISSFRHNTMTDSSAKELDMGTSQAASATPSAGFPVGQQLLRLDRLTDEQRQQCLQLAASSVAAAVTGRPIKTPAEAIHEIAGSPVTGAFVTLKRGSILRGCCGVLGQPQGVGSAISSAAIRTAREDQRMAPISVCELPHLHLDVTLLGPLRKIEGPSSERAQAVIVGKHGLLIQHADRSGLLLPSVAIERGWDAVQFLRAVCNKAQLPMDAWQDNAAVVMIFEGKTMSDKLSGLLPSDLPTSSPAPLTAEQLAGYAQVACQNIAAMATGGTPSYVIPHLPDTTVNAIVMTLQWIAEGTPTDSADMQVQQGNAIQVSFRPGLPVQSTLFQMCQRAAELFVQRRFSGQLTLGLTIGFDPAMHGYGDSADLNGVDTSARALVISEANHCGFVFDGQQSAQQLLARLQSDLPIGSRQSSVHSLGCLSTLPQLLCISAPNAQPASGVRAPAVAGRFYPAEDAARRALVNSLCRQPAPEKRSVLAAMVPHAGLKYSGRIAAQVWQSIQLPPGKTMIIVSPKHTAQGVNWAVCPQDAWGLSNTTTIAGDRQLSERLAQSIDGFELDAAAHVSEHGIEVQLPFLERIAPTAKVVGVAMHGGSWPEIFQAAKQLAGFIRLLDDPPLLVISSDMNHYANDEENRRRDRLALDALAAGEPEQLMSVCRRHEISMCGLIPAALILETLRQLGHQPQVVELDYATSADVSGDKSRVVGYAGLLFV